MIAFGSSITDTEAYRALRRARDRGRRRRPARAVYAFAAVGRYRAHLQPDAGRARPRGRPRGAGAGPPAAEIVDPASASRSGGVWPPERRPWPGARAPPACAHRLVGRDGQLRLHRSPLRRPSAAVSSRHSRGPSPIRPPAEVDVVDGFLLVLSPWAVRNVRFDEIARARPRVRLRLLHAGARRRAQGGDCRPALTRHHARWSSSSDPELWVEKLTSRWPRSGTAGSPAATARGGRLEGARAAGRRRARGGAGDRLHQRPALGRAPRELEQRARGDHREPVLAGHRPAARGPTGSADLVAPAR